MKKLAFAVLVSAMLVSCGNSPKSILSDVAKSQYRVAEKLCSDSSAGEMEDVLDEEIEKMKDLYDEARDVSGTPLDYFRASCETQQSEDCRVAESMARGARGKIKDAKVLKKWMEFGEKCDKVDRELKIACKVAEKDSGKKSSSEDDVLPNVFDD